MSGDGSGSRRPNICFILSDRSVAVVVARRRAAAECHHEGHEHDFTVGDRCRHASRLRRKGRDRGIDLVEPGREADVPPLILKGWRS